MGYVWIFVCFSMLYVTVVLVQIQIPKLLKASDRARLYAASF